MNPRGASRGLRMRPGGPEQRAGPQLRPERLAQTLHDRADHRLGLVAR